MATKRSITIGDHVHYAPEDLEAETASLTPVYVVGITNNDWTVAKLLGAPDAAQAWLLPTKDLVAAQPEDLTETSTDSSS